jgi:hypothetical protein
MKQVISEDSFLKVLDERTGPPLSGRWAGVSEASPAAVRTLAHLVAGSLDLRYVMSEPSDPALKVRLAHCHLLYRTSSERIFDTGTGQRHAQDPEALILFAAYLLLRRAQPLAGFYLDLLNALNRGLPQSMLNSKMSVAAQMLLRSCAVNLGLDRLSPEETWFYEVEAPEVPELSKPGLSLGPLLSNRAEFWSYLQGTSAAFAEIKLR